MKINKKELKTAYLNMHLCEGVSLQMKTANHLKTCFRKTPKKIALDTYNKSLTMV